MNRGTIVVVVGAVVLFVVALGASLGFVGNEESPARTPAPTTTMTGPMPGMTTGQQMPGMTTGQQMPGMTTGQQMPGMTMPQP